MYVLIIFLLLTLNNFAFSAQWFCKEGSSKRFDNTFEVCGIGNDLIEDISRKKALNNAFNEFDLVCNKSDDCKGKYKQVSPLRTDCDIQGDKYICYRAFYIIIDPTKAQVNSEDDYLSKELEKKEKELIDIQNKYGVIVSEKIKVESDLNILKEENNELKNKINQNLNFINENKNLNKRLKELEIISNKIRKNINNTIKKEKSLISLIKAGMNVREVDNILGTNYYEESSESEYVYFGKYIYYLINFSDKSDTKFVKKICYNKKIGERVSVFSDCYSENEVPLKINP